MIKDKDIPEAMIELAIDQACKLGVDVTRDQIIDILTASVQVFGKPAWSYLLEITDRKD